METSIDFIKRVSACGRACALMTLFSLSSLSSQLLSLQDVVLTHVYYPSDRGFLALHNGRMCEPSGKWDLIYGLTLIYCILTSTLRASWSFFHSLSFFLIFKILIFM